MPQSPMDSLQEFDFLLHCKDILSLYCSVNKIYISYSIEQNKCKVNLCASFSANGSNEMINISLSVFTNMVNKQKLIKLLHKAVNERFITPKLIHKDA